jgi:2-isopropylmalate synthase/UPF0716 protein FxsA
MISSAISSEIGGLLTFIELVLSIFIGMIILRTFQFSLIEKINEVKNGQITQDEFVKSSIGKAIGAILLIVPGFFTDILGLFLQFGMFTLIFSRIFRFKPIMSNNSNYSQQTYSYTNKFYDIEIDKKKGDEDVIDVEVIDDNKHIKH